MLRACVRACLAQVGLVLDADAPAQLFTAVLRKLALTLRAMELESAFLSDKGVVGANRKTRAVWWAGEPRQRHPASFVLFIFAARARK